MAKSFYKKSLEHFGLKNRSEKLVEEMLELGVSLIHFQDLKCTHVEVIKEIADVYVLLLTICEGFGVIDVNMQVKNIQKEMLALIDLKTKHNGVKRR